MPGPLRIEPSPKRCPYCGDLFYRRPDERLIYFHNRKFCSREHHNLSRQYDVAPKYCPYCDELLVRKPNENLSQFRKRKFCSNEHHHLWRKMQPRKTTVSGYHITTGGRYVHRMVMEEHLGRPLSDNEVVHHIDGNSSNNDISNLQVMSSSEHSLHHSQKQSKGELK